ncbi:Septin-domain-containing protein [Radiomyces spectabilis]|uniref:Septin-domain-containing protein n=1 Tax=Radiomyces spectabilis TaxID=64574 RepID=UPI002220C065|nr:Septin-domain-containing protein [Radiomyces spectabilis]KAI8388414.1 Septin-domain-containing protein [Radiomyces spectabilis]
MMMTMNFSKRLIGKTDSSCTAFSNVKQLPLNKSALVKSTFHSFFVFFFFPFFFFFIFFSFQEVHMMNYTMKRRKRDATITMNILVVGSTGTGKTSFVQAFYDRLHSCTFPYTPKESHLPDTGRTSLVQETVRFRDHSTLVTLDDVRMELTVTDTPGLLMDQGRLVLDYQILHLMKFIDDQFDHTLSEETKVKRDTNVRDTHIHACLYFLNPTTAGHLGELDHYMLRLLSSRVNIIPILNRRHFPASSIQIKETLARDLSTAAGVSLFSGVCLDELRRFGDSTEREDPTDITTLATAMHKLQQTKHDERRIAASNIYKEYTVEEEDDEEDEKHASLVSAVEKYSHLIPFVVADTPIAGRKNNAVHGICDLRQNRLLLAQDNVHTVEAFRSRNDLAQLQHLLLVSHREMLRDNTVHFYECYRTERLIQRKITRMTTLRTADGTILM